MTEILTDEEVIELCFTGDSVEDLVRNVEAAVIRKLSAGVSVEPDRDCEQAAFEDWVRKVCPPGDVTDVNDAWKDSSAYDELITGPCITLDQLQTSVAAARVQALHDAMQAAGPEDSYQDEWFKAKCKAVEQIRALLGKEAT